MSDAPLFVATTFTEIYERVLVRPLFRPFAEQLLARLAVSSDDSVDVSPQCSLSREAWTGRLTGV